MNLRVAHAQSAEARAGERGDSPPRRADVVFVEVHLVARRRYVERVVQLVAFKGCEWLGCIDLEDVGTGRQFRSKNLKLGAHRVTWGNRLRSLREVREWFTSRGADRVHLVYATSLVKLSKA